MFRMLHLFVLMLLLYLFPCTLDFSIIPREERVICYVSARHKPRDISVQVAHKRVSYIHFSVIVVDAYLLLHWMRGEHKLPPKPCHSHNFLH